MPPTTNSLMQITDGTTTITIMDSAGGLAYNAAGYRLKYGGYSPKVASKRTVILGGQDHYNDVEDSLTLQIKGSTADDCYGKLDTLIRLLSQSTRWYYGENVSPVVLKYQPKGSNLTGPCQRLILHDLPDNNSIVLPGEFDDAGTTTWLAEITIRFMCRGLWQTLLGTDIVSGALTNTGNIINLTSTENPTLPAPTTLDIDLSTTALIAGNISYGYLFVVSIANQLGKIDASSFTGTNITSVADASNLADGNIMRFTPTAVSEARSTSLVSLPNQYVSKKIGVYCTFRVGNVATAVFQARLYVTDTLGNVYNSPYINLANPVASSIPSVAYLGSVSCDDANVTGSRGFVSVALQFIGPSSIASTPRLDIDSLIIVGLDDEYSNIMYVTFDTNIYRRRMMFYNKPLTYLHQNPYFSASPAPSSEGIIRGIDGNQAIFTKGTNITVCYLATEGTSWRLAAAGPTLISIDFNTFRENTYLVPR